MDILCVCNRIDSVCNRILFVIESHICFVESKNMSFFTLMDYARFLSQL